MEEDGIAFAWGLFYSCGPQFPVTNPFSGNNDVGQLGLGADLSKSQSVNEPTLVPFTANTKFLSVSLGSGHTLGVSTGGILFAWGKNNYGQLGIGPKILETTQPMPVPTFARMQVNLLAVGRLHRCFFVPDLSV